MFEVNFDESYDGVGDVLWSVAGWIGPESAWQSLNRQWDEVFSRYPVSYFHATDCEGGHRDYKGWNERDKDSLRFSLIHAIESVRLTGISCAINVREAPHIATRPEPYFYGMEYCIVEALRKTPSGEKMRIVFGKHDNANGKPKEVLNLLRASLDFECADRISSDEPKPGLNKHIPGLQAADMLAYETYKHARGLMAGAPTRKFYSRLEPMVLSSQFFNGSEIQMLIQERAKLEDAKG